MEAEVSHRAKQGQAAGQGRPREIAGATGNEEFVHEPLQAGRGQKALGGGRKAENSFWLRLLPEGQRGLVILQQVQIRVQVVQTPQTQRRPKGHLEWGSDHQLSLRVEGPLRQLNLRVQQEWDVQKNLF